MDIRRGIILKSIFHRSALFSVYSLTVPTSFWRRKSPAASSAESKGAALLSYCLFSVEEDEESMVEVQYRTKTRFRDYCIEAIKKAILFLED